MYPEIVLPRLQIFHESAHHLHYSSLKSNWMASRFTVHFFVYCYGYAPKKELNTTVKAFIVPVYIIKNRAYFA